MESWKEELYSTSYGDDLAHYGIEGMKWGVRRYQKADGTLTEEGKARYRDDPNGVDNAVEDYAVSRKYWKDTGKGAIKDLIGAIGLSAGAGSIAGIGLGLSSVTGSAVPMVVGNTLAIPLFAVAVSKEIKSTVNGIRASVGTVRVSKLRAELNKAGINDQEADRRAKDYLAEKGHTRADYYHRYKQAERTRK